MTKVAIIFLVFSYFLSELPSKTKQKRFFCIFSVLGLILISGLRSIELGYDTENYLTIFHESSNISWSEIIKSFWDNYFTNDYLSRDPGFVVLEKSIGLLTNNDQLYLIFIAIICIVPISRFIYSHTNNKKEALLAFTYYVFFYYSYIPNSSIRQSVALSILLLAYNYLGKGKVFPCIIVVVFASFIHKTALIFVIFLLLHVLKLNKVFFKYCLFLYVLFLIFYQQLSPYITMLFGDVYSMYASSDYFSGRQQSFTYIIFLTLIYMMFLIPVFLGYEKDFEKRKLLYLGSGMAFVLTPFMLITPTILRITVFFAVCNFVIIPHTIKLYKSPYSNIIYLSILLLLVFMGVYSGEDYYFFWE